MKIFITGASKGLGFYLAEELLIRQHAVWGIGRSEFKGDNLTFPTERFKYTRCDTTINEETENTFAEMVKSDFIPDIVVFCAGAASEDIKNGNFAVDRFKLNFNNNLFGVMNWVELFLPYFIRRKKGAFAGISSMSIYRENHRNRIGYSVSKLSLNKAFENLQLEYLSTGIKFSIFNIGRLNEKRGFIGISYKKAAALIAKILETKNIPNIINMPFSQLVLTKIAKYIPDKIFCKYFYK